MKIVSFLLLAATVLTLSPLYAQGRRSRAAQGGGTAAANATAEEAAPKTGVRFVIVSPAGNTMPSPLYVQTGKDTYKSIALGARTPSMRVKPIGGKVNFWDKNPAATGMESGDKKPAAKVEVPEPIFSVTVPANAASKAVCILSPNKDVKKTQALFLNESDFPRKGMHIINLSSFPLQVTISESGDFKDKKESKIGVYHREEGICENNSWSFKGEKGQTVAFMLTYSEKGAKAPKRLKASTFVISERQSMINIVVKDPVRNMPKLMPLQISEASKRGGE